MKPWRYHPKALENRLSLVRFVKSEVDFSELRAVAHAVFTALWPASTTTLSGSHTGSEIAA